MPITRRIMLGLATLVTLLTLVAVPLFNPGLSSAATNCTEEANMDYLRAMNTPEFRAKSPSQQLRSLGVTWDGPDTAWVHGVYTDYSVTPQVYYNSGYSIPGPVTNLRVPLSAFALYYEAGSGSTITGEIEPAYHDGSYHTNVVVEGTNPQIYLNFHASRSNICRQIYFPATPVPTWAPWPTSVPWPTPGTPTPFPTPGPIGYCGPIQMTLVIDRTGSMGGAIASVKNELPYIVEQTRLASNGDYKIGVVSFNDEVAVNRDMTGTDVTQAINSLSAMGGAGWAEASDEALRTTINSLKASDRPANKQTGDFTATWSSDAGVVKIVILITDATPGGFDDVYTDGVDNVEAHNRALEAQAKGIKISAVYIPTRTVVDPTTKRIMEDYATTTGGAYTQTDPRGNGTAYAINQILASCGGPIAPSPTALPLPTIEPQPTSVIPGPVDRSVHLPLVVVAETFDPWHVHEPVTEVLIEDVNFWIQHPVFPRVYIDESKEVRIPLSGTLWVSGSNNATAKTPILVDDGIAVFINGKLVQELICTGGCPAFQIDTGKYAGETVILTVVARDLKFSVIESSDLWVGWIQ